MPVEIASIASSSLSNTFAGPLCLSIAGSTALFFTTAPSAAMLPLRIANPPVGE